MGYIHSITITKTSYMQKLRFVSLYIQIELWHNIKESCHAKNCCLFGKFQCIYTSNPKQKRFNSFLIIKHFNAHQYPPDNKSACDLQYRCNSEVKRKFSTMWIPVFSSWAVFLVSRSRRSVEFIICLIPNHTLMRPSAVLWCFS